MRTIHRPIVLGVVILLCVGMWSLRHGARPIGVVIITLDTTRADRLSPYGFMDAPMPALDRLARDGVVFDRATSVAPLTLPAHSSLFTGLVPPRHGVRDNGDPALGAAHTTLAEVLSSQGFRTGAFVGSAVLNADRGLAQGFEIYRGSVSFETDPSQPLQRRAKEVISDATHWLDQVAGSPYFLWVHLYDAHRPYRSAGTVSIPACRSVHWRTSLHRFSGWPAVRCAAATRSSRPYGGHRRGRSW